MLCLKTCNVIASYIYIYICVNITFAIGHLSPAVECVRLIIDSFCWVDYLANKGCRTSLPVILSLDCIRFQVNYVRTVIHRPLFIRNPYMFFNDKQV